MIIITQERNTGLNNIFKTQKKMKEKDYLNKLIGELEKAVEANKFSKSHEIRMEIINMNNFFATEYANYLISRL